MNGKKVLVIGGGGREHALCWKLAQSPCVDTIFASPGNGGTYITRRTSNVIVNLKSHPDVIDWCRREAIDLVLVGPEDPLAQGIADSLNAQGIPCFGPSKAAAQIEASKEFAKTFMDRHGIPTAHWKAFTNPSEAKSHVLSASYQALVVKASGLAGGKGVIVAEEKEGACKAVDDITQEFGDAGRVIIIEECLEGQEVSVMAFSDGKELKMMPGVGDHKRLGDGDKGPNTGGMGAYCPSPFLTPEILRRIHHEILEKTILALQDEGTPFIGVLYAGIMLTKNGPKVLEFNCRFGDPETQVLMPLLRSDLFDICWACVHGNLNSVEVGWKHGLYAVGTVLVSPGYPGPLTQKGTPIQESSLNGREGLTRGDETLVFHAGTNTEGDRLVTSGGRVLCVVGLGESLLAAAAGSLSRAKGVAFPGVFFRRDIAAKALACAISNQGSMTYAGSGVSISEGDSLVRSIAGPAKRTQGKNVLEGLGGFAACMDLKEEMEEGCSILLASTDGVGTKLKLAQEVGKHRSVGVDLVAMCANDILCQGGKPLFFLDYYACGKLVAGSASDVIAGIVDGCHMASCALVGGETAEMPGMYRAGEYDLAGFVIGMGKKEQLLPKLQEIHTGDVVVGIASSGLHSNGFSLVRRILDKNHLSLVDQAPFLSSVTTLGDALLTPTLIYVKSVLPIIKLGLVKGCAHITGGGLPGNVCRILPQECAVSLDAHSWNIPPVFPWIALHGNVSAREMLKTFNLGLGMVLIMDKVHVDQVLGMLRSEGETAWIIGDVISRNPASYHMEHGVDIKHLSEALGSGMSPFIPPFVESFSSVNVKHVAVFISGTGTNLQALIDAVQSGVIRHANIVLVVSNNPDALGLKRANEANIETLVRSHKKYPTRVAFDLAIHEELVKRGIDLVCLAGFMRILSKEFVALWKGRVLNTHPSLLPAFKGHDAHRLVLEAGVRISGCTVHFVEVEVDAGAVILQHPVPIFPRDTLESLQERVKGAEHVVYPRALEAVASGAVVYDAGRAIWKSQPPIPDCFSTFP